MDKKQISFASAVYNDKTMTVEQKLFWLEECVATLRGREQREAENYLARFRQELDSEFIRPLAEDFTDIAMHGF